MSHVQVNIPERLPPPAPIWYRFQEALTERKIPAHYDIEQFEEDLTNLDTLPRLK